MKTWYAIEAPVLMRQMHEGATGKMREYLDGEIDFVASRFDKKDKILVLGCSYGREMLGFYKLGFKHVFGLDHNPAQIYYSYYEYLKKVPIRNNLYCLGAERMTWPANTFDWIIWIQNGLFTVSVDKRKILSDSSVIAGKGVIVSSFDKSLLAERKRWLESYNETNEIMEILPDGTTFLDFRPPIEVYDVERFNKLFERTKKAFHWSSFFFITERKHGAIFYTIKWGGPNESSTGADNSAAGKRKATTEKH
jgi:SAM-dependent methyltransferase